MNQPAVSSAGQPHASPSTTGNPQDRRQYPRVDLPLGYSIIVEAYPDGQPQPPLHASIRDISVGGLAFLYPRKLPMNTYCTFALHGPERVLLCQIDGEVRRCEHLRGAFFDIGVQWFTEIRLDKILTPAPASAGGASNGKQAVQTTDPELRRMTSELLSALEARQPIEAVEKLLQAMHQRAKALRDSSTSSRSAA
jgi:hypothetical protein